MYTRKSTFCRGLVETEQKFESEVTRKQICLSHAISWISHWLFFDMSKRLDLSQPRYDQNTFEGRAKHFFKTTNPLNVLASDTDLERAKNIVESYRNGTEDKSLTEDEIWDAKELYDSAYHCQTGEKLFLPGRMSFQVCQYLRKMYFNS